MSRDDETLSSHRTRTNLRHELAPVAASVAASDQPEAVPAPAA